ncbi:hypothetical protein QBC36DRAFT_16700 [Triangularia setosa]|uniref:Uncharacterized protein n=1 Tax=Triangularia setosa TaxID=2587417 RepID=A0AAN7A791_9PEZI|nr:hypothetical protein QBC36DRAFT_16700 [Podospora setosa]
MELFKAQGGLILKTVSFASFLIAILALWQTISSSADTRRNTITAEWSAKQDFLEFCKTHALRDPDCQKFQNTTLELPPEIQPSQYGKYWEHELDRSSTKFTIASKDYSDQALLLTLTWIVTVVQVHLKCHSREPDSSRI